MKEICMSIPFLGYFRRFVPVQPIGEIPSAFAFKIDKPVLLGFDILIDIIQPVSETETGMLYEPTNPISFYINLSAALRESMKTMVHLLARVAWVEIGVREPG